MNDHVERRQVLMALAAALYARPAFSQRPTTAVTRMTDSLLRELLPKWPDALRSSLLRALAPENGGRIDAQTLAQLSTAVGSVDALMTALVPVARTYSRPPLSNFHVGAIALGKSGALYPGANIEVPQSGLNQAVHAEQSAIANAFGHKEAGISAIAVGSAPCGHCRQFMNEIAGGGKIRILIAGRAAQPLQSLLPDSFGPADLGLAVALFSNTSTVPRLKASANDTLSQAALAAASYSYAPHTKALSGCAMRMRSGTIVSGSYIENAAFNPSLAPLQSALVAAVMHQEEFRDITAVVLVERADARISQQAGTRMVLAALAPQAVLRVVTAAE